MNECYENSVISHLKAHKPNLLFDAASVARRGHSFNDHPSSSEELLSCAFCRNLHCRYRTMGCRGLHKIREQQWWTIVLQRVVGLIGTGSEWRNSRLGLKIQNFAHFSWIWDYKIPKAKSSQSRQNEDAWGFQVDSNLWEWARWPPSTNCVSAHLWRISSFPHPCKCCIGPPVFSDDGQVLTPSPPQWLKS